MKTTFIEIMQYKVRKVCQAALLTLGLVGVIPLMSSCSDEPDQENFYTFTGEMMSDYLKSRPQFSDFVHIVEKANMMDLLATYGHYTCFAPTNEAISLYLQERGLSSVSQLSFEDCDTIVRTHLLENMYTTFDMTQSKGVTLLNYLKRYISPSSGVDDSGNPVVVLEGTAHIDYYHQNDSVENGIMQPIDRVIYNSNSLVTDLIREDASVSIFYNALVATGVIKEINNPVYLEREIAYADSLSDPSNKIEKYSYTSHTWHEVAWVPDTKKTCHTLFVEPDEVLRTAFAKQGISTENGDLKALYDLAAGIYGQVYPNDVSNDPNSGWSFNNLTDSINPLRRFVQYHVVKTMIPGAASLTPPIMKSNPAQAFGINEDVCNPCNWYQTLLPHTMIKVERLTRTYKNHNEEMEAVFMGHGIKGEHYLNRKTDEIDQEEGAWVNPNVNHVTRTGNYFYIGDVLAFSTTVRDHVQNMRIRMDFSNVFMEVMSNDIWQKGNPYEDDKSGTADDSSTPKNGKNYYFPEGYLDGVSFSNCHVVLRRPHTNFWSWQGDEWNIFGDYDFSFRIPPVPYTGEWQIRLGFCALETRGVAQIYFDNIPQGIPLDMTAFLNSETYLGSRFASEDHSLWSSPYDKKTPEEKAQEQKLLKNLGAYRAGCSMFHFDAGSGEIYNFTGNERTFRRILCQRTITANEDHYIRFRVASDGKQGNNNEFMLDYIELVPKSVYGVDGSGEMEDDL